MEHNKREIFAAWMTDHRGIIIKIVRSFTTDPTDAEDLTQEITLAVWRSIDSFRGDAKPSTWIWRIALNKALSVKRSEKERPLDLDDVVEPAAQERAEDGVRVDRIYAAIRTLAPIDRSLIMLSLEGYSYAEVAAISGLTETNVGARLSRARTRLSTQLEHTQ